MNERRSAVRLLRQERRFVDAIFHTTTALILVMDTEGRVVRFNKACEEASGLPAAQVEGREKWQALVPAEERAAVRAVFESLRAGRLSSRYENHWQRPDGSRRLIEWSNTVLLDAAGRVQYVVATGVDVTDLRRAEAEVLRHQAEIAQLHRDHAVGELATLLAHELNQPLAAIAGYAEASLGQLMRGEGRQRPQRNLQAIVEQAQRAVDTIRDLARFLAKGGPEKVPADLGTILRAACSVVEHLAGARGIRLDCGTGDPLPRVIVQPMHIEHVLVNLLQNALESVSSNGRRGGIVRVSVRREGEPSVRVAVEDDGPGIDAALAEQVFEPLYTTKTNGLGLGLSVCRSVVAAHGGKIWAAPGPGGKFYFTLPLAP